MTSSYQGYLGATHIDVLYNGDRRKQLSFLLLMRLHLLAGYRLGYINIKNIINKKDIIEREQ